RAVTLQRALSLLSDNTRLLLHGGDVFDVSATWYVGNHDVLISSYGTGQASIRWTGTGTNSHMISLLDTATNVTFRNLKMTSKYNVADPVEINYAPVSITARGNNIAVLGCTFDEIGDVVNANGNPHALLMQD